MHEQQFSEHSVSSAPYSAPAGGDAVTLQEIDHAVACQFLEATIAAIFRVPLEELRAPTRGRAVAAFARQVAMYTAHVALGLSLTEVGLRFGRDRTTAAHACRLVEDRRDDLRIDRAIENLEAAVEWWHGETLQERMQWS